MGTRVDYLSKWLSKLLSTKAGDSTVCGIWMEMTLSMIGVRGHSFSKATHFKKEEKTIYLPVVGLAWRPAEWIFMMRRPFSVQKMRTDVIHFRWPTISIGCSASFFVWLVAQFIHSVQRARNALQSSMAFSESANERSGINRFPIYRTSPMKSSWNYSNQNL